MGKSQEWLKLGLTSDRQIHEEKTTDQVDVKIQRQNYFHNFYKKTLGKSLLVTVTSEHII